MELIKVVLLLLIAVLHGYFMVLEMCYWTKPYGMKVFGLTKENAEASKVLAQNQGLYNGFLAAGLLWAAIWQNQSIAMFFLTCVVIAGLFGAYSTKNKRILYVQAIPAFITALIVILT